MSDIETIKNLRDSFESVVPKSDGRVVIPHLEFIVTIVFNFIGDKKTSSLDAIRRSMKVITGIHISRGAFWERLAGNRLRKMMESLVERLMSNTIGTALLASDMLNSLNVLGILILDSSTITLTDGAKKNHPGTGGKAGIKWHACFDIFSGHLEWFKLTESRVHDSQCFPDLKLLKGKLIIYDLGYFDYQLMLDIIPDAFFLCRLKSNSVVTIVEGILGFDLSCVGQSLLSSSFDITKFQGNILEAVIEKSVGKNILKCRSIGFWNPDEKCYHWYLTNLLVPAKLIYSLYRLRWQIELIFKACKDSLNADGIPSANSNIIESLLLGSIAAHLSSETIHEIALNALSQEQSLAISFQRIAYVLSDLKGNFIDYILNPIKENIESLLVKIHLMIHDIYDPNYNNRRTSKKEIYMNLIGSPT